jgi:hypothetical protein
MNKRLLAEMSGAVCILLVMGCLAVTEVRGQEQASAYVLTAADSLQTISAEASASAGPASTANADLTQEAEAEVLPPTLKLSGQVRHRSEADYRNPSSIPVLHLLRTRLNVAFQPVADVTAFVQVQDARTFGSENPAAGQGTLDGRAPALDLHQAYFAVSNLFDTPFGIRIGRQELAYGNQRLIGNVAWSNFGRAFDAGVASYRGTRLQADAFAARLVDDRTVNASQNIFGLYGTWKIRTSSLDIFALLDNNTASIAAGPAAGRAALERYTAGVRWFGTTARFDYELEGAYQSGHQANGDEERALIEAYLLHAAASVRTGPVRLGALYTILSGDGDPDDGRSEAFNTLFATNHKFYGYLDLFPFNAAMRPGGLHNASLQGSIQVTGALNVALDLHHFALAEPLSPDGGKALGQEADLTVNFRYNQHFGIVGGASVFFASDTAEAVLGKPVSSWLYLSTTVDF